MAIAQYCLFSIILISSGVFARDPEEYYNAIQLITSKGYPAEEHNITTPDGYILGVHRIPHGKNESSKNNGSRPVFFLQHGLLCSSTNWLTNLETESFAYLLADAGFDVWMGNVRGNTYSRMHKFLKPNDKRFWQFSFDEHSQIDLHVMIDHVIKVTSQHKIRYVGHSQGTMMGFAGFSHNKTLASHIEDFYALAPVATVKNVKGLFEWISEFYKPIEYALNALGTGEFFPNDELLVEVSKYFCDTPLKEICGNVLFLICGFDRNNLNESRIPVYLTHTPAGTSLQNVVHWSQMVKSGDFQMYNYGSDSKNHDHYGQNTPPFYHLSNLTVPTTLFTGSKDWLADPKDVAKLIPQIKPVLKNHTNIPYYEHLDFIWGKDAHIDIYHVIIKHAKEKIALMNNNTPIQ